MSPLGRNHGVATASKRPEAVSERLLIIVKFFEF